MKNRLARYCEGVMEAGWLVAVIITPLFFNVYSSRVFEPDKAALLRLLALVMLAAWVVKSVSERAVGSGLSLQRHVVDRSEQRHNRSPCQPPLAISSRCCAGSTWTGSSACPARAICRRSTRSPTTQPSTW
jgi:hypothetical protein